MVPTVEVVSPEFGSCSKLGDIPSHPSALAQTFKLGQPFRPIRRRHCGCRHQNHNMSVSDNRYPLDCPPPTDRDNLIACMTVHLRDARDWHAAKLNHLAEVVYNAWVRMATSGNRSVPAREHIHAPCQRASLNAHLPRDFSIAK